MIPGDIGQTPLLPVTSLWPHILSVYSSAINPSALLLLSDFLNCPSTWCRIEGCHPPPIYDRYKRSGFLKIFCCKLIREVPREQFLQSNSWFMMLLSDYNNTVFKIDKKLRTLHDANQSLQNFRKWYSHMLLYFCCIVPFMIFLLI